jgi:hypothetical protein
MRGGRRRAVALQVLQLIQAAGDGMVRERPLDPEGFREVAEGPPPLVKCAAVEPLPPHLRPVILQRSSGKQEGAAVPAARASEVFQYKADHPGAKAVTATQDTPQDEVRCTT